MATKWISECMTYGNHSPWRVTAPAFKSHDEPLMSLATGDCDSGPLLVLGDTVGRRTRDALSASTLAHSSSFPAHLLIQSDELLHDVGITVFAFDACRPCYYTRSNTRTSEFSLTIRALGAILMATPRLITHSTGIGHHPPSRSRPATVSALEQLRPIDLHPFSRIVGGYLALHKPGKLLESASDPRWLWKTPQSDSMRVTYQYLPQTFNDGHTDLVVPSLLTFRQAKVALNHCDRGVITRHFACDRRHRNRRGEINLSGNGGR
ncbi:uncharacterized protein B0H18DRAFT_955315 [Fomitopsis serialis]|uniref:uncharacterized protein n=1 Tax=Fomitopsis serialis TaxID=139415 RepID=UPI002008A7DD|nr:uncharacterized protein B0H18DRAFT_955315 [Neoantrodia serialis]KAH9924928.1 hypothetical protein B0H18DRAFT_955315 [Neoantrodia serialis]